MAGYRWVSDDEANQREKRRLATLEMQEHAPPRCYVNHAVRRKKPKKEQDNDRDSRDNERVYPNRYG